MHGPRRFPLILGRPAVLAVLVLLAVSVVAPVAARPALAAPPVDIAVVDVPSTTSARSLDAVGWVVGDPIAVDPFAMLGLEVEGEDAVEVRTARDGGPWSDWVAMPHQHDEGPDAGTPEALATSGAHLTHPVFVGEADALQVRSRAAMPVRAHLIDPFGLSRSLPRRVADRALAAWHGSPPATASATVDMPAIVTRAQWGADESIVRNQPSYSPSVERAFVHHTVGSNSYSREQASGVVRGIQAYHVNGNGWSDIGYNFLVDRFGTIYEGRAGGMDRAVIGAQAGGFNTFSTGVALMGTFTDTAPPAEALAGLHRVIAWKADVHHFHPLRTATAVSAGSSRYPEGTVVELANVSGHRDVSSTSCPGGATYARMGDIRQQVRQRAGDLIVDHRSDITRTRVIRGDPDADAVTVQAQLDPPGDWTVEVRDPLGEVVHREDGTGTDVDAVLALTGAGWTTGTYTWAVSAPGRRTASGTVAFVPPTIEDLSLSAELVTVDAQGVLDQTLEVRADLWTDAAWQMQVLAPDGTRVHHQQGQGPTLDATWATGALAPGTYEVQVAAEDAVPGSRTVEVRYDLLDRAGDVEDPIGGTVTLSGATFAPGTAQRAVIARHDVFADALTGGPLAGGDGPLLLTTSDALDPRVVAELDRALADDAIVYVLGGSAAIAPAVVEDLVARYGTVIRVAGASRFATAAAIGQLVVERSGTTTAMVARAGPDDAAPWADALAGGAYGAWAGVPVLLSDQQRLSGPTEEAIDALGITDTIVLGGTAALGPAVEQALPDPTRLAGPDRAATGAEVARRLWAPAVTVEQVVLANGFDADAWAWALASAPLAARLEAPLLLTTAATLSPATGDFLDGTPSVVGGRVVGPERLVSAEVGYAAGDRLR